MQEAIKIDFQKKPLSKNTPIETRQLQSALLTFDDNTTLLLEVEELQGIYRVSEFQNEKSILTIHEIFITFGETIGTPRSSQAS